VYGVRYVVMLLVLHYLREGDVATRSLTLVL
jgi:hypothetical protein